MSSPSNNTPIECPDEVGAESILGKPVRRSTVRKIDAIVTHRWLGIPVFFAVIYVIFSLTFRMGEIPMRAIEGLVAAAGSSVAKVWPAGAWGWGRSLVVDGIIDGVGGVLVFLPTIVFLFLGIAILEESGYMARATFVMDRFMRRIGLAGTSFLPMILGFGCSVPAIMATRMLKSDRDRIATMMVIPLMSCGSRLAIYSLIIPAFFPPSLRAPVLWVVYLSGVFLAIAIAKLLRSTVLKGEAHPVQSPFPPYRLPSLATIGRYMWMRAWLFLRKAGTIILAASIVMWALSSYPRLPSENARGAEPSEALEYSVAGRIGHALEPAIKPLGFDWRIGTSLVAALAAKEVFISEMAIVFSLGDGDGDSLRAKLREAYSPLTALCVMLFLLIATPCLGTVAIVRRESGRWRYAVLQFAGLTALAYVVTLLVYQVGSRIL